MGGHINKATIPKASVKRHIYANVYVVEHTSLEIFSITKIISSAATRV